MPEIDGKKVFDEDARLYDLCRPSYPDQLVKDVLDFSQIDNDSPILEIGCGTGQATASFARNGNPILCLEPGPNLSAIARENFAARPNVEVETVTFEDWPLTPDRFGLVISDTAFHWVKADIGFPKAAFALRDQGTLALFWNKHPGPYSPLIQELDLQYGLHAPEMAWEDFGNNRQRFERWVEGYATEIGGLGLFDDVTTMRYPWSQELTADEYVNLLNTYSDHRALPKEKKSRLYDGMREVINRNGGVVVKDYVSVLFLARRKTHPLYCV